VVCRVRGARAARRAHCSDGDDRVGFLDSNGRAHRCRADDSDGDNANGNPAAIVSVNGDAGAADRPDGLATDGDAGADDRANGLAASGHDACPVSIPNSPGSIPNSKRSGTNDD
jgi:hypothetical protein